MKIKTKIVFISLFLVSFFSIANANEVMTCPIVECESDNPASCTGLDNGWVVQAYGAIKGRNIPTTAIFLDMNHDGSEGRGMCVYMRDKKTGHDLLLLNYTDLSSETIKNPFLWESMIGTYECQIKGNDPASCQFILQ